MNKEQKTIEQAQALVDDLIAAKRQDRFVSDNTAWISVEDRLPIANLEFYLIWRMGSVRAETGLFIKDLGYFSYDDVTHWQSLPEPPKVKVCG